jgi:hypothetical protein
VIYRRAVGVEDQDEGRGGSRVNFHSARAWFAEQCELTGAPTNFITRLLGWHVKGAGMLPRYSKIKDQPEFIEKLREIVESINLPR